MYVIYSYIYIIINLYIYIFIYLYIYIYKLLKQDLENPARKLHINICTIFWLSFF